MMLRTTSLCLPLMLAASAPAQTRSLDIQATAAGTELSIDDSVPFRSTTRAVENAQLVELEGSERFVVTWDERLNDHQIEPWYAISLDGHGMSAVKSTSYEVKMRRTRFEPEVNGAPDFSGSRFPSSGEVYIVQLVTQPIEEYFEGLTGEGAAVYKFVAQHSFLVRMPPSVRDAVAELPYVRWIGAYHPEYRVEPAILAAIDSDTLAPRAKYNVQVFEVGLHQKEIVADFVAQIGGSTEPLSPDLYIVEAELTPEQLLQVAALDEVLFIDRWGAPEEDLNIVRNFSGANYVETMGAYTGTGVRGEVMDSGLYTSHVDFQHNGGPLVRANSGSTSHGTQVTGTVFGDGTGNSKWRGMLPDGKIVFRTYAGISNGNRYNQTAPIVNPALNYQCVFQTNSWGDPQVTIYNNASTVMDDIIFGLDLMIFQSQSNTGNQTSRPQAWAKNVVSVGGINHNNTLTTADDSWCCGSTGPAEDGRVKPDLAHFYDAVTTPAAGGGYASFGGTSCATPCTAGTAGLFFEMWHAGEFNNNPTGSEVFQSRPHYSLAKAALIATANQWQFNGGGANLARVRQGWGAASVQNLYDMKDRTFYVDQTDVIDNLQTISYAINVLPGESELKICMTWPERGGTTSAAQHRFNDLDIKVTRPDGTFYWGSRGLKANMYNNSGGDPKDIETVENVFVNNPQAGNWTIEVIATELTDDIVASAPGLNAVYSMWVSGATEGAAGPQNYCTAGSSANGCQALIAANGTPSATATSGFTLDTTGVEGQKDALYFFGTNGRQANPWGNGSSLQCVTPPVIRAGLLSASGTSGQCDGSFSQDMNALWCPSCPKPQKNPGAGAVVQAQMWYRDPGNTSNQTTSLSNAVEFLVAP